MPVDYNDSDIEHHISASRLHHSLNIATSNHSTLVRSRLEPEAHHDHHNRDSSESTSVMVMFNLNAIEGRGQVPTPPTGRHHDAGRPASLGQLVYPLEGSRGQSQEDSEEGAAEAVPGPALVFFWDHNIPADAPAPTSRTQADRGKLSGSLGVRIGTNRRGCTKCIHAYTPPLPT
jgi:hypothetical protein